MSRLLEGLFKVQDTPRRVALAFGIGVFIAFFPILGIHTGLALAIGFRYRLSRAALLLGAYLNNPWTIAPMFAAGTMVGCVLLGVPMDGLSTVDWHLSGPAFLASVESGLLPLVVPFLAGNLLLGVVGGYVGYLTVRSVLERRSAAPAS